MFMAFFCRLMVCRSESRVTPPTVGRPSADLSADKMPDFSYFSCSSADKNKIITTLL